MNYHTATLLVQVATLGVLFLTLRAVNRYVQATNEIKKAAVEQAKASLAQVETSLMPYVTLKFEKDEPLHAAMKGAWAEIQKEQTPSAVHIEGSKVTLLNIGRGPAIRISYTLAKADLGSLSATLPHLQPSAEFEPALGLLSALEGEEEHLHVRYESLTGTIYRSDFTIERDYKGYAATKIEIGRLPAETAR